MFSNIGNKIKGLAKFVCVIGIILSVIYGVIIMFAPSAVNVNGTYLSSSTSSAAAIVIAIIVILVGAVISWLSSLCLYGFGQLIDNSTAIREKLDNKAE